MPDRALPALALIALLPIACAHPAPARGPPATAEPSRCGAGLPEALRPPPGHRLALELAAAGVQIYACQATPAGTAWVFRAPEATLRDLAGAPAEAGAIPWLLLSAKERRGAGRLAGVTYVQRIATAGGLAPAGGCAAESLGAEARVPYTASYCFLAAE